MQEEKVNAPSLKPLRLLHVHPFPLLGESLRLALLAQTLVLPRSSVAHPLGFRQVHRGQLLLQSSLFELVVVVEVDFGSAGEMLGRREV